LRLFSFGDYGLALAALALVVFGAIECLPIIQAADKRADLYRFEMRIAIINAKFQIRQRRAATTNVRSRRISNPPPPLLT